MILDEETRRQANAAAFDWLGLRPEVAAVVGVVGRAAAERMPAFDRPYDMARWVVGQVLRAPSPEPLCELVALADPAGTRPLLRRLVRALDTGALVWSADDAGEAAIGGQLYLCHAGEDGAAAATLADALRRRGCRVVTAPPEERDGIGFARALGACAALVAVVGDAYARDPRCYAETVQAHHAGKLLFGVRVAPLAPGAPAHPLLEASWIVDGTGGAEPGAEALVAALTRRGVTPRFEAPVRGGLAPLQDSPGARPAEGRSPYPGLAAFREEEAGVFVGREAEIERGVALVRAALAGTAPRAVFLLGASGSGKSSLLRAGMLPLLRRDPELVVVGPFRPGPDPVDALVLALAQAFGRSPAETALGGPGASGLAPALRRWLREEGRGRRSVLVVVDQLEEALGRAPEEASPFLALVRDALDHPDEGVSLLASLRSDQLAALQADPAGGTIDWAQLLVGPLDAPRLRRVIEEPARLAGLHVEAGLVERLVADAPPPHALPLLAHALRHLWDRRTEAGLLTSRAYEEIGGVQGAVARTAEDALGRHAADPASPTMRALRASLLRMVRLDERGNAVRQSLSWSATDPAARPLLERLVRSRLLVRTEEGVEVAHEALFRAWGPLARWVDEARGRLVLHQQLAQAARIWAGGTDADLWRGARLARALKVAGELVLSAEEATFLDRARAVEEAARREEHARARERERLSRVALARGLAYQAVGEAERPQRALLLACEAVEATRLAGFGVTPAAESALHQLLVGAGGVPLGGVDAEVGCVALGDGGVVVGCEEGTVAWLPVPAELVGVEAPGPGFPARRWRAPGSVRHVEAKGPLVLARTAEGGIYLGDLAAAAGEGLVEVCAPGAKGAVGTLSGGLVVYSLGDDTLASYDPRTGAPGHPYGMGAPVKCLAAAPGAPRLAVGLADGCVLLADTHDGLAPRTVMQAHGAAIKRLAWAAQAPILVLVGEDKELRRLDVGDVANGVPSSPLASTGSPVLDLAVSGDGALVVAGTWHTETLCWSAQDQFTQPVVLQGHSSSVHSVAIRGDGTWIATGSARDSFVLLWEVARLAERPSPLRLTGEDAWIEAARFLPSGVVLAVSSTGRVRAWEQAGPWPASVPIPTLALDHAVTSADGAWLLAPGDRVSFGGSPMEQRARLVDLRDGSVTLFEGVAHVGSVAMSPDGRVLVLGGADGEGAWLDRASGASGAVPLCVDGWWSTLEVTPDGTGALGGGREGAVWVDLASGTTSPLPGQDGRFCGAAFAAAGQRMITADAGGRVMLWRREPGGWRLHREVQHPAPRRVALGEDRWLSVGERSVAGGRIDGDTEDTVAPLPWHAHPASFGAAWSGDLRSVVVYTGGGAVWMDFGGEVADAASPAGAPPAADAVPPAIAGRLLPSQDAGICAVAMSPAGDCVALATVAGALRLWRRGVRAPVELPRRQRNILRLQFLDGGRRLRSFESGVGVLTWDVDPEALVARARAVAGRALTAEEHARFLSADGEG